MNQKIRNIELNTIIRPGSPSRQNKLKIIERSNTNRKTKYKSRRKVALKPTADNNIKIRPQFSCTKSTATYYSRDTLYKLHEQAATNAGDCMAEPNNDLLEYLNENYLTSTNFKVDKSRSPLKIPSSFRTGLKLLRHAKINKKPSEARPISDKQKIVQNIYYKNDKYYYSNKIQFSTVLQKIYYENYKINDIKEYILPCFKRLSNVRAYFDILFREAKQFSESVKSSITNKIEKLVLKEDLNGEQNLQCGINPYAFMPFSKACRKYEDVIGLLYDNYRHLEAINVEIEKLTRIYLENYIEKNKPLSFDTLLFHRSMFINNVYKDNLIHSFIEYTFNYFKQKTFYWNNYPSAVEKISEIYENLEFNFNFDNESESCKDECCGCERRSTTVSAVREDYTESAVDPVSYEVNAKKAKKNKKKKKKAKKTVDENQNPVPRNTKESDEVDSLYTLFCSRISEVNHLYAPFTMSDRKPNVAFSKQTRERFDKLIVC